MWSTHSICQTRPTGPFPLSMCCWRMSQEGFMLRIHAMTPSLLSWLVAMLVKRRVTKRGRCVRQYASSRLPIFLCVQKKTQVLQFLWVLDGIQFRASSTSFFFPIHLTAVKTILQITLPYRKQPLLTASGSNCVPDHICMCF